DGAFELLGVFDQLLQRLGVRVLLLEHHRVRSEAVGPHAVFDDAAGNADHRGAGEHGLHHHRVRADARVVADGEAAEDLGAAADDHALPQGGMTLRTALERSAAERHALVDGAAVADLRGLADHHAHAVIDEHARAELRAGMDLDAGDKAAEVRSKAPEQAQVVLPEPARDLVDPDRVQAGIAEQDLARAARRRVPFADAGYVWSEE